MVFECTRVEGVEGVEERVRGGVAITNFLGGKLGWVKNKGSFFFLWELCGMVIVGGW